MIRTECEYDGGILILFGQFLKIIQFLLSAPHIYASFNHAGHICLIPPTAVKLKGNPFAVAEINQAL